MPSPEASLLLHANTGVFMEKMLLSSAFCLLLFSHDAMAVCSSYPHTLTNGTMADATQVMDNLNCAVLTSGAIIDSPTMTGTVVVSTSMGIGTTSPAPYAGLDVEKSSARTLVNSTTPTNFALIQAEVNGSADGFVGVEGSIPGTLVLNTSAYATVVGNSSAHPLQFSTQNSVRMALDTSGNLTTSGTVNGVSDFRLKKGYQTSPSVQRARGTGKIEPCLFSLERSRRVRAASRLHRTASTRCFSRTRNNGQHDFPIRPRRCVTVELYRPYSTARFSGAATRCPDQEGIGDDECD